MNDRKSCLMCKYAMKDPNATPDQIIAGQVTSLCVYSPPTTFGLMTSQGMALMTTYPHVNAQTLACSNHVSKFDNPKLTGN